MSRTRTLPKIDSHAGFTTEICGRVAIVRFSESSLRSVSDLNIKTMLLKLLEALEKDPDLRVILMLGETDVMSHTAFQTFLHQSIGGDRDPENLLGACAAQQPIAMERLGNALIQIAQSFTASRKLTVTAMAGDVASPFFGTSLASDYRIVDEAMTFYPSHCEMGYLPGDGPGFSAPGPCSRRTIRDLLLANGPLSATELERRGLVDACLPTAGFEEASIAYAQRLAETPLAAIAVMKLALGVRR